MDADNKNLNFAKLLTFAIAAFPYECGELWFCKLLVCSQFSVFFLLELVTIFVYICAWVCEGAFQFLIAGDVICCSYLEAYNKAKALGDVEDERKRMSRDAELVDKYNASKRSVSLVQKHREESSRPRKKVKQPEKEEWEGMHPWKPWDREKDLTAGRKKVNFDSENMAQGLASRFSSGNIQRNFL